MRYPRLVIGSADDGLAQELRPLASARRWLVHDFRRVEAIPTVIEAGQPTVLILQATPYSESPGFLSLIPQLLQHAPDLPIIVVSDEKVTESDRPDWVVAILSLGASYVAFPPITGPVLEDLVSGFMLDWVGRSGVKTPGPIETIDLAKEGQADELSD